MVFTRNLRHVVAMVLKLKSNNPFFLDIEMECIVCMEYGDYVVQCGSTVKHTMCHPCAITWRAKTSPMVCPVCRGVEKRTYTDSRAEWLTRGPIRIRPKWCESGLRQKNLCFTQNKTMRECSMAGCEKRVCRACAMCDSHSDF